MDLHKIPLQDPEATRLLGERLGNLWQPPTVLLLSGNLGAGKTTCVQGIAQALGVAEPVTSPTFALIEEYEGLRGRLVHMDLYRLRPEEVPALGIEEIWEQETHVVIEWPERLPFLPACWLRITFCGENPRLAELTYFGPPAHHLRTRLLNCYGQAS